MANLKGPLFSQKASKQLGKSLIYKQKGNRSLLTKYNKPGGNRLFNPSATQKNQRMIYNLIIANWQVKSTAQKKVFNDLAKSKNLQMSGWNYFLKEAMKDLPTYLGLQGYWAFNRIVGGDILDLSGNENHGDLKPSYPANSPDLVESINKKFGKAGNFDGIDNHVSAQGAIELGVTYTLSWWSTVKNATGERQPIGLSDNDNQIYQDSGALLMKATDSTGSLACTTPDIIGVWAQYTIVSNSNFKGIYRNGILEASKASAGRYLNDSKILIGCRFTPGFYWNGLIDEVRIYNRELGAEEIKKHYQLKIG